MQNNYTSHDVQAEDQYIANKIEVFFKHFRIGTLAHRCGIVKSKGISPTSLLLCIFQLPFMRLNLYRYFDVERFGDFGKDAAYDFMRSYRFSWRRFLFLLAGRACSELQELTSDNRETVLILDDSTLHRPRSKKVELLARVFDHSTGRFLKGFRLLGLCWSDGTSLIPLDFALLSSPNANNRLQEATDLIDKRTCGAKRRQEAVTKCPELIAPMLKRARNAGIEAKYLLMDSWFGMPSIISQAVEFLPVICMIKRTPKIHYTFENEQLDVMTIYKRIKKRRGRAQVLASVFVKLNNGLPAKIVFVRNKHKKDWLALLSTDIELADAEVVRIYGKRWDIEVFFRTIKQHLGLEKDCQARNFDTLIAHTTLVMVRYMFLALQQRRHDDPRTLGLLFHACCEEVKDLGYFEALQRIMFLAMRNLKENKMIAEQFCKEIMAEVLKQALHILGLNRAYCQRTVGVEA